MVAALIDWGQLFFGQPQELPLLCYFCWMNYSIATATIDDLPQIIAIQYANLPQNVTEDNRPIEGFVSVQHNTTSLKSMCKTIPQVVAKKGEDVVGFALSMTADMGELIPMLIPMFSLFETLDFNEKRIADCSYYVMGQICIDFQHRRQGLFKKLYKEHKRLFSPTYDFCLTEIAAGNTRSLNAHFAVGFIELKRYVVEDMEWVIVGWDWS